MHYNCEGNIDVQCCSRFNSIVAKDALGVSFAHLMSMVILVLQPLLIGMHQIRTSLH